MYTVEDHEKDLGELINFLNVTGVDQAKLSTIIQGLRDNYSEVSTTFADNTKKIEEFNTMNEGLRSANMSLLSKLGTSITDLNSKDKEEFKSSKQPKQEPPTDVISLDDITKNFI